MDAQLMAWLKKRGPTTLQEDFVRPELGSESFEATGGEAPDIDRKPLPTESGTAEPSQESTTPEDNVVLDDSRASPGNTDMRQSFDRMSNVFMAAGGLPQAPLRDNPYRNERDSMRDWVLKRSASQRADANTQNQESRTAAYLAATQSQREQGLAGQALRAEQEGRRADAEKTRLALEAEKARAAKEKAAADAEMAKRKMELEEKKFNKKSAPKPVAAPDEVEVGDVVFQYQGRPDAPKEARTEGAKEMRKKGAQWNTVTAGLDALEKALTKFIVSPTPANAKLLEGPALSAASATNAALGQGAMSGDEKAAQFSALGAKPGDLPGIQALVKQALGSPEAAQDLTARVRQMKQLAKDSVAAQGQSYGYKPKPTAGGGTKPDAMKAAREWLAKNPNHPDAPAVRRKIEASGG